MPVKERDGVAGERCPLVVGVRVVGEWLSQSCHTLHFSHLSPSEWVDGRWGGERGGRGPLLPLLS